MSCIHFKFKSSLEYEKLTFDGLHISLSDLKEAIMKQKKIGSFNQYTLSVVDAQSKKEYKDDQEMVPRNTSVIISRVPVANPTKAPKTQRIDPSLSQPAAAVSMTTTSSSFLPPPLTSQRQLTASELQETADLAGANASEEDKVMAMMNQSSKEYDPSRYVNVAPSKGPSLATLKKNPPPPNYICHRCGKKGHWIQFCPTNGDPNFDNRSFKRSLGTPSNQIISAPLDINMPGVMLDRHGNLVMRTVDYQAFMAAKSKAKPEAPAKLELPDELTCPICKKLVKDAVIIQCCSESFCYECIQEYLCENEFTCPLCKATDISPETLVPNKALRTAAKNFQMKESEQKSVSEARGYIPMVTPQQVAMSARNVSPAIASTSLTLSSGGVGGGEVGKASGEIHTKEKKDGQEAKPEETESKSCDGESQGSGKGEEEKSHPSEKRSSPAPANQPPRHKNRSEALLDRILSSSAPTSKKTPPPPSTSTVTSTSTNLPPPTATAATAQKTASTLLAPSVSTAGLTTPAIAASALLAAAAASGAGAGGGGGVLNLAPRANAALPGQGAVLTTSAVLPPVVITEPQEDSSKLERIAAELLMSGAAAVSKKSASPPPPLSAEEFYRQQKLLKILTKQTRKRTPSPFSVTSGSRSTTPDSYVSNRSYSNSSSMSRSRSHSQSSRSSSSSRSRSPIASRHSRKSTKKHRHRHRHEKTRHEKSRDREKERKTSSHYSSGSKRKRKRRLSPEAKDTKSKHSRRHHHTSSPDRKKHRDNHTPSSLADSILSPESNLGASTPDMEVEPVVSKSSASHHKRHHKKRSKTKHRRREKGEESMEVDREIEKEEAPEVTEEKPEVAVDDRVENESEETVTATLEESKDSPLGEEKRETEAADEVDQTDSKMVDSGKVDGADTVEVEAEKSCDQLVEKSCDQQVEKPCDLLVPYQDSSTTEVEGMDEERRSVSAMAATTTVNHEEPASHSLPNDQATMAEAGSAVKDSEEGIVEENGGEDGGKDEEKEEEKEANVTAEDSLLISVHVNDTIDGTSGDLLDAECPSLQKTGREDGELTDSSKDEGDDILLGPADGTESRPSSLSDSQTKAGPTNALLKEGVASKPVAPPTSATRTLVTYSDDDMDELKDDEVDLRVLLEQQKSKKQATPVKKHFASAVTVASGMGSLVPSSSHSLSSGEDSHWSSDQDLDSPSSSESSSEVERVRKKSSKSLSNSKHVKKSKRKHSTSGRSHREKEREREKKKKRVKAKERKSSNDTKKKSKEREKDRSLKKKRKHKKSDKYSKYA